MKSMLIIDGSEIIATLFAQMFQRRGWKVAACGNRDCALDLLVGNETYDVVILGNRTSGIDSLHLLRFIRALEHRKTTAVVMVAGRADLMDEALAAGADEVLLKPINPTALMWAVDKHVP
jgi:DNA-binding response OmpR family regulator